MRARPTTGAKKVAKGNKLLQAAISLARKRQKPRIPVFTALGERFGAAGKLFGGLIDVFRVGGKVTEQDVQNAKTTMEQAGLPLTPGGIRSVDLRKWAAQQGFDPESQFLVDTVPDFRQKMLQPSSPEELPPTKGDIPGPRSRKAIPDIDTEPSRSIGPRVKRVREVGVSGARRSRDQQTTDPMMVDYRLGGLLPPTGDVDIFAQEEYFSSSSNVYSMAYDETRGILYVTYMAPGSVGVVNDVNSCNGKRYTYNIKPNERGPMYAYGGAGNPVPKSVWEEARKAGSAGKFVWDKLRVCGSFTGHQYKYSLVSPSMSGSLYIPRKAVIYRDPETNQGKLGFRERAVPTVGTGRRPYVTSDGDYVT